MSNVKLIIILDNRSHKKIVTSTSYHIQYKSEKYTRSTTGEHKIVEAFKRW